MKQQDSFGTLCSRLGVNFLCPYCQSESIVKSGKNCNGKQRYQCKYCHKRFITDYTYKAYLPDTDSKITQLTKEGLGIRSTAQVLGISVTTLLKRILQIASKSKAPIQTQSYYSYYFLYSIGNLTQIGQQIDLG